MTIRILNTSKIDSDFNTFAKIKMRVEDMLKTPNLPLTEFISKLTFDKTILMYSPNVIIPFHIIIDNELNETYIFICSGDNIPDRAINYLHDSVKTIYIDKTKSFSEVTTEDFYNNVTSKGLRDGVEYPYFMIDDTISVIK